MNAIGFGARLRELRKRLGKSQSDVAAEISESFPSAIRMSQATMSSLEQRPTAPRGDVVEVLASYYNVPVSYFFASAPSSTDERIRQARDYIRAIRDSSISTAARFAHTSELRQAGDGIDESLASMSDMGEEEDAGE